MMNARLTENGLDQSTSREQSKYASSYKPIIIINIASIAFFVAVFESRHGDRTTMASVLPQVIDFTLFLMLLGIALASLKIKEHRISTMLLIIIILARIAESLLAICHGPLYIRAAIADFIFPFIFLVMGCIFKEYFGEFTNRFEEPLANSPISLPRVTQSQTFIFSSVQPSNPASESEIVTNKNRPNPSNVNLTARSRGFSLGSSSSISSESISLRDISDSSNYFSANNSYNSLAITSRQLDGMENICLGIIVVVNVFVGFCALLVQENNTVDTFLLIILWVDLVGGCAYIFVVLLKVRSLSSQGVFFSDSHSHGFAAFLLLVGIIIRIVFYAIQLLTTNGPDGYIVNLEYNVYLGLGREIMTQIIPYGFHFFNLRRSVYLKKHKSNMCNASARIKFILYVMLGTMQFIAIGIVHEEDGAEHAYILSASRVAGYLSAIYFSFVAVGLISPLIQLFYQYFNFGIMQHTIHKIRLHKNLVFSACSFALIHVTLHIINKYISNEDCNEDRNQEDPPCLYKETDVPFVTGIIMVVSFVGALITGTLLVRKQSPLLMSSLHVPLACAGFIAFFVHGSKRYTGYPFGDRLIAATFLISLAGYLTFYYILSITPVAVDKKLSKFGTEDSKYILLVLHYSNCSAISPGSFFMIYANTDSNLSNFHAHPFPVFSGMSRRIAFLIRCGQSEQSNRETFTSRLRQQPSSVKIQGPFQGPARRFIHYLCTIHFPTNIYLCGLESGFSSIFSLLEHLKQHPGLYNLQTICCTFSPIDDPDIQAHIHTLLSTLCSDWKSPVPVTIIECDQPMEEISRMAGLNKKIFITKERTLREWRNYFPRNNIWVVQTASEEVLEVREHSKPTDILKALYYCGNNFKRELFPMSQWPTCCVEATP